MVKLKLKELKVFDKRLSFLNLCDEVNIKNINKDIIDVIEVLNATLEFETGLGILTLQI